VREAALRYLKPENLVLLAVGDVARFAEKLGRFGTVEVLPADIQEQASK